MTEYTLNGVTYPAIPHMGCYLVLVPANRYNQRPRVLVFNTGRDLISSYMIPDDWTSPF